MDLSRHLRYFVVVAEELHFGRAAEALGIAQPPLSQAIQRLERELDVKLFDRSGRRVRLTAAGQLLAEEARTLLARESRMRALMRMVGDGSLGTLRVGVPPEMSAVVLHRLLDRLAALAPRLQVDLHELTSAEQACRLVDGRLDVGLVHHPIDATGLRFGPTVAVRMGVVLPRDSPHAWRRAIAMADLAGHDLILGHRDAAPGWYDEVILACRAAGFTPARIHQTRNPEFLFGLVLAGQGVAFEQEAFARREPRVAWRPLAGAPLRRRSSVAWPSRSPHPAVATFSAAVDRVLAQRPPAARPPAGPETPRPWTIVYGQHGGPDRQPAPAPRR
jgi:DNA-binding transcriptional LysR family regulator